MLIAFPGCSMLKEKPLELHRNAAENVSENDKEIVWRLYDERNVPRYVIYTKPVAVDPDDQK